MEVPQGRLISVGNRRLDPRPVLYFVAEPDPDQAVALLKKALGRPNLIFADLGPLTHQFLNALQLEKGTFTRA